MRKLKELAYGGLLAALLSISGNVYAQYVVVQNPYYANQNQVTCYSYPYYYCVQYQNYSYPQNPYAYSLGYALGGGYNTTSYYNPYWGGRDWRHHDHHGHHHDRH